MKSFDVAIIGSGPAGASAALELAAKGFSTVIIEKETLPRYKTCGGGLVYRGRKNLPFDISSVVEREFYQVDAYFAHTDIKLTAKKDKPVISMIMRDAFDHLIVQKAEEKGVTLLQNHEVTAITFAEATIIHTSQGDIEAKFIIAADGALSPIAKMAGWKETRTLVPALEYEIEVSPDDFARLSQEVRFDIDAVPYGYGWCFPKKDHLSVGVGVFSKNSDKINLKKDYATYLASLGITNVLSEQAHGYVIPVSPRTDGFIKYNVFLTGDAAGFADPIFAEGISNSIVSGILVAQAIAESNLDLAKAKTLYMEKLEEDILPQLRVGVIAAKYLYRQKTIRNFFARKYGSLLSNALADVFMGDRTFPKDYKAAIRRKLKEAIF